VVPAWRKALRRRELPLSEEQRQGSYTRWYGVPPRPYHPFAGGPGEGRYRLRTARACESMAPPPMGTPRPMIRPALRSEVQRVREISARVAFSASLTLHAAKAQEEAPLAASATVGGGSAASLEHGLPPPVEGET
jgi:hypothetical protein